MDTNDMGKENKEKLISGKVGAVACIDDDAHIEGIKFGFVASLVTETGRGNLELFPDSVREIISKNRRIIFAGLKKVSDKVGVVLGITSHPGCGGAALQDIKNQFYLNKLTSIQSEEAGTSYIGCLPVGDEAKPIANNLEVFGYMAREESEHIHKKAGFVDITVGGGIDDETKLKRSEKRGFQAFELSADWISYALKDDMSKEDVLLVLKTEIDIAKAIIDKAGNPFGGVELFDAGKLGNDNNETNENISVVNELLASLRNL